MASNKWKNVWDDTLAVLGSVYGTPKYTSGTENGLAIYTAPAAAHFSPDVGAPARHVNYALKTLGDDKVKELQHAAMCFSQGGDWASNGGVLNAVPARGNRAFVVASAFNTYVVHDVRQDSNLSIYSATVTRSVMLDDGVRVWTFDNQVNGTHRLDQASATHNNALSAVGGFPLVAGGITNGTGLIITTSGTGLQPVVLSGTAFSSTASPAGTYSSSTSSKWGKAQAFVGANTATGPLLFYSRDVTTNNYLYSTNGSALNQGSWPVSTSATKVVDVSYDDVQSLFVLCTVPTAGGSSSFYTSPDGVTWTVSGTATGPAGGLVFRAAADGASAFSINGGVWLFATQSAYHANEIYGQAFLDLAVNSFYSLDYGQTWYKANMSLLGNSTGTVKIAKSLDRFCVYTDKLISLSGRMAYPEVV